MEDRTQADTGRDEAESFGQRLRRLREARGLTVTALAAQVGRSASWLSRVEGGSRHGGELLGLRDLRRLAAALGATVEDLTADIAPPGRPRPASGPARAPAPLPPDAPASAHFWRAAGLVLREERGRAGVSRAELAREAGVSEGVVALYEAGRRRNPGLVEWRRLAAALGYTWDGFEALVAERHPGVSLVAGVTLPDPPADPAAAAPDHFPATTDERQAALLARVAALEDTASALLAERRADLRAALREELPGALVAALRAAFGGRGGTDG